MRRPNTSFGRCWGGAAGLFSFLPRLRRKFCRAVQADFLPSFLCWFPDTFFVTRATLSMYLKAHTSANAVVALLSRNHVRIVLGSSKQAIGDLPGVSCKSALSVLSLHSYTVSPVVRISSWLVYSDPTVSQSSQGIIISDPQS